MAEGVARGMDDDIVSRVIIRSYGLYEGYQSPGTIPFTQLGLIQIHELAESVELNKNMKRLSLSAILLD